MLHINDESTARRSTSGAIIARNGRINFSDHTGSFNTEQEVLRAICTTYAAAYADKVYNLFAESPIKFNFDGAQIMSNADCIRVLCRKEVGNRGGRPIYEDIDVTVNFAELAGN